MDPIHLSKELIKIESVTPANHKALDFISKKLEILGYKNINRLPYSGNDSYLVDNLYAKLGDKGKNLCFAGHVDVVPPGNKDLWTVDPFTPTIIEKNGKKILYGRGSIDMKSSLCAFISAISEVINEPSVINNSISFLLTGDEECGSINGTKSVLKWLKQNNEQIDLCLLGEMTSRQKTGDYISIGRRGSMHFYLTVYGKQGHIAYPENFINPITIVAHIINDLKKYNFDKGSNWFSDTKTNCEILDIKTNNIADNVIPSETYIHFNIRFTDGYNEESLKKIINNMIATHSTNYKLKTWYSGGAFVNTDIKIHDLIKKSIHKITGIDANTSTSGGTSDARFIHELSPTIELGLLEDKAHQIDECVEIDDIYTLKNIYKDIIISYFTQ